jgi:hypothetical protein
MAVCTRTREWNMCILSCKCLSIAKTDTRSSYAKLTVPVLSYYRTLCCSWLQRPCSSHCSSRHRPASHVFRTIRRLSRSAFPVFIAIWHWGVCIITPYFYIHHSSMYWLPKLLKLNTSCVHATTRSNWLNWCKLILIHTHKQVSNHNNHIINKIL